VAQHQEKIWVVIGDIMINRDIIRLVLRDNVQQVLSLLKSRSLTLLDTDADGRTLLHAAVSAQSHNLTAVLISLGADVHAKNKFGMGPLSEAVRIGNMRAIVPLIQAGADPNEQDVYGFSPMHHAMLCEETGVRDMLRSLLQLGANVSVTNLDGASVRDWILRNDAYRSLLDDESRPR